MKYISVKSVVEAYKGFQDCMTNKSWGYLALLKGCNNSIEPSVPYEVNLDGVSNFLENIFNLSQTKKQYNSGGICVKTRIKSLLYLSLCRVSYMKSQRTIRFLERIHSIFAFLCIGFILGVVMLNPITRLCLRKMVVNPIKFKFRNSK